MNIHIGADHNGFLMKEYLKERLVNSGHEVIDHGNDHEDNEDDYPDFAQLVSAEVVKDSASRGVLVCGSGVGMSIAANKFPEIRAAVAGTEERVRAARRDDDLNVLCLAADFISLEQADQFVQVFLETEFLGEERHVRRIEKIGKMEPNTGPTHGVHPTAKIEPIKKEEEYDPTVKNDGSFIR